jgi:hypothetical protein
MLFISLIFSLFHYFRHFHYLFSLYFAISIDFADYFIFACQRHAALRRAMPIYLPAASEALRAIRHARSSVTPFSPPFHYFIISPLRRLLPIFAADIDAISSLFEMPP